MCLYVTNSLHETVPMLWVNTVPLPEDARFGLMQPEMASGPSAASDSTNLIWGSDGHVSDTPTATLTSADGEATLYYNDNFRVSEGSSGEAELASGAIPDGSLVMNTIDDPTPDQGSGGDAPIYGYAKCQWLRHARGELPGSACSATWGGSRVEGYVFQAAAGTMECGRLLAINNQAMDAYQAIATGRCPRGSPVDTANYFPAWTRRLLVGGCMIPSDPEYDSEAEVHVPQDCSSPADYKKGCLFPTALNFDPTAVQPGLCEWPTIGCMDPTAYNYNSLATDSGPCIAKVPGCSIFQGLYNGLPNADKFVDGGPYSDKFSGGLPLDQLPLGMWDTTISYNRTTALSYSADATDPADCVIAIEGCMDPSAANYDSMATVDSGGWCRPLSQGCMDNQESINFDADHTVDSGCIGKAPGCTNPAAINYNSRATLDDGSCKAALMGCGHPKAVNYDSAVTTHNASECLWFNPSPPAPPAPPLAPGGESKAFSVVEVVASFDVEVSDVLQPCSTKGPGWNKAGCFAETLTRLSGGRSSTHTVTAGSAVVTTRVAFESESAADAGLTTISNADPSTIDTDGLGVPSGLTATRQGTVYLAFSPIVVEEQSNNTGAIVGGVVGGVVFVVLIALAVWYWFKKGRVRVKKRSSVTPGE